LRFPLGFLRRRWFSDSSLVGAWGAGASGSSRSNRVGFGGTGSCRSLVAWKNIIEEKEVNKKQKIKEGKENIIEEKEVNKKTEN